MSETLDPAAVPAVREKVVELLASYDPVATKNAGRPIHASGHPFAAADISLLHSATREERTLASERAQQRMKFFDQIETDSVRLHELAQLAPETSGYAFTDALLDRGLLRGQGDQAGDVPAADILRRPLRNAATLAAAFRELILPDLGGDARTEALNILSRLDLHLGGDKHDK